MASSMAKLYKSIGAVVNLAASYLKAKDERTNDVIEELERITTGVGLAAEEVQFPVEAVKQTDLKERLPCMVDRGGMKEVLRFTVEDPDEDGTTDITLEVWKKTRKVHAMVREIGTLHAITIKWGLFQIPLNVISIKTGECEEDNCIVTVDSGDGVAFFVRQFDFAAFRVFFYEEEEISAGVRLLYMAVLDADKLQHVSVEDFAQWEAGMVLDEIDLRKPGDKIRRFTAEEAGLVPVRRGGDEGLLGDEAGENGEDRDKTLTEAIMETLEGSDEDSSVDEEGDLGQSPELEDHRRGEKSKLEGKVNLESLGARESLRSVSEEEEMDPSDLIDAVEFSGLNKAGEKVVLSVDQMRGIRDLLSHRETDWSEEAIKRDAEEFDPVSFLVSVQETDPEARLIKVRKSVHQPWIEEDKRRAALRAGIGSGADAKSDSGSHISGREMWSEDDEDEDEEEEVEEEEEMVVEEEEGEWETEVMPDVTISTEASIKSPRAELSMNLPSEQDQVPADGAAENAARANDDDGGESDQSIRSPPAKKVVVQWTDDEEKLALPAASQAADWSPTLVKVNDGRPILNVSTSSESEESFLRREGERIAAEGRPILNVSTSSESDESFLRREGERITDRDVRNQAVLEEMRQIDVGQGEPVMVPDNDVYSQVVQVFYQDDDEVGDIQDVDEGVSED